MTIVSGLHIVRPKSELKHQICSIASCCIQCCTEREKGKERKKKKIIDTKEKEKGMRASVRCEIRGLCAKGEATCPWPKSMRGS